LKNNL